MLLPTHTLALPRAGLVSLLALGLCACTGIANAYSRMGDAEVRMQDGQPCFTITAKEFARAATLRLQAVVVFDASTKPGVRVWSMGFDADSLPPLLPSGCIPYGQQAPAGAQATPAAPLQVGRAYKVYVNARTSDGTDPTRGRYAGLFCLAVDAAGARQVVPLQPGTRGWRDEVCD